MFADVVGEHMVEISLSEHAVAGEVEVLFAVGGVELGWKP
jgi:hypothetical protein